MLRGRLIESKFDIQLKKAGAGRRKGMNEGRKEQRSCREGVCACACGGERDSDKSEKPVLAGKPFRNIPPMSVQVFTYNLAPSRTAYAHSFIDFGVLSSITVLLKGVCCGVLC